MFIYDSQSPQAVAHNDNVIQSICNNPVLWRNFFPIIILSKLYYSTPIIYPPVYSYPEFGFKGADACAELNYIGTDWAIKYKPAFPGYIPHTHTDILEDLRITAPNGNGLYIYGGGKFLRPSRLLIHSCKGIPFHIEAFDSGFVESLYILENHSPIFNPSKIINSHATSFIDLKVRENKTPLALLIEDCSDLPVQGTIESNTQGLGLLARKLTRSNRNIWFEANNRVNVNGSDFHRFQAEIYESPNNTAQSQSHREKNLIYYDEISYAGTREDSIYLNEDYLEPVCDDFSFHLAHTGYTHVAISGSPGPINTFIIKKDGYSAEINPASKSGEMVFADPEMTLFIGKKDQFFTLSFDVDINKETADYLAQQIRTGPKPIPLFYFGFSGGTIAIADACYIHKPGLTHFKFVGKAANDFTGIRLFVRPILWPSTGPEKDFEFKLKNVKICCTKV